MHWQRVRFLLRSWSDLTTAEPDSELWVVDPATSAVLSVTPVANEDTMVGAITFDGTDLLLIDG